MIFPQKIRLGGVPVSPFVLALFAVIGMAWVAPSLGSGRGMFSLSWWAHGGISVIFFFYGLKLDGAGIRAGVVNFRLHLLIQMATFALFPILILAVVLPFGLIAQHDPFATTGSAIWLGIFFLAALPSTVSSSVVMVHLAKGNLPAAIFNASLSSLFGLFLTPLWMRLYLTANTGGMPWGATVWGLIVQVMVPIGAGIVLNHRLGRYARRYEKPLQRFDQSVILLIVYTSFCQSFAGGMFDNLSISTLATLSVGMIALFFIAYKIIWAVCVAWKFSPADRITAVFCGSKKSLVHGTVMSAILLADPKLAGLLLLPTMLYHAFQLAIVGVLAQRNVTK